MSIIRAKREHNYTVISNKVYDKNQLSWQAMGMLGYLLTKPDDWLVIVSELVNVTKETAKPTGKEGVYNILKELRDKGFIVVQKNSDGSTNYTVYDEPLPNQGKPNQAEPNQAEPTLLNTDIQQVLSSNKDGDVGIAVADKNLSGIVDITAYIEEQNVGVNLLLCDNILSNLFTGLPKKTVIMDKYDISNGYLYRQREKIKRVVAALETTAILKLQDEFESCRIIDKAEVLGIIML